MLFSPNSDGRCYKFFHRGKQIPFENGEIEEVWYNDEGHYFMVKYTCCGEVPKDEIPIQCGKEENGHHEIDEKFGIISKLEFIKTKPGQIRQKQMK